MGFMTYAYSSMRTFVGSCYECLAVRQCTAMYIFGALLTMYSQFTHSFDIVLEIVTYFEIKDFYLSETHSFITDIKLT